VKINPVQMIELMEGARARGRAERPPAVRRLELWVNGAVLEVVDLNTSPAFSRETDQTFRLTSVPGRQFTAADHVSIRVIR